MSDECMPSFLRVLVTWKPEVSLGTRKSEKPLCPASRSLLATTRHQWQRLPLVMKIFLPLMTYSLP